VPLPPLDTRTLQATGARRTRAGEPDAGELVRRLRREGTAGEGIVMLFDARAIAGEAHLLSAWAHLGRARARGEARLRDRGAELALYVAGDDQLPRALAKVGVGPDTEAFVLVAERPRVLDDLLAAFGLEPSPPAYPRAADETTLDRLGIGPADRSAVPRGAWDGLVLERVALLELEGA
jgi:tRNA threonylcarbamoyladenosine modification (KEOPS) complex Cgi121 subunit